MKNLIISFSILFHFCFTYSAIAIQLVHKSYFEYGSSSIDKKEVELLVSNLEGITSNTTLWIIGYADESGKDSQNIILSQKRAEAIKNLILKKTELQAYQIKAMANGIDKNNISNVLKRRTEIFSFNESENKLYDVKKSDTNLMNSRNLATDSEIIRTESTENIESKKTDNLTINESIKLSKSIDELKTSIDLLNKNLENKKIKSTQQTAPLVKQESEPTESSISERKSNLSQINWKETLKNTSFELDVNYYLADQNANLDPVIDNNNLLSDPRLSINLNTETSLNSNLSIINKIGISWNEYSDKVSSGLDNPWARYAFNFSTGLKKSINQKISQSLKLGFDQMLNHELLTPSTYNILLEPIIKLSYGLQFNALETKNVNFKVSPEIGMIWGLDQIDHGFSYGLNLKSYFGNNKKYYVNTSYTNNSYRINDIKFRIELLELGFGIKF